MTTRETSTPPSPAPLDGPEPASSGAPQRGPGWVLWAIALSGPFALLLEEALRRALFPPEMDELRALLSPPLTRAAWVLVGLTGAVALVGPAIERWLRRRAIARATAAGDERAGARAPLEALYVATTLVQAPALVATFVGLFGASSLPVWIAVGVSALGVVLTGLAANRQ